VRRRAVAVLATTAALALAACTSTTSGHGHRASSAAPSGPPSSSAVTSRAGPAPTAPASPSSSAASACPSSYLAPDPDRPRMTLAETISADHRTVTGHEVVAFTPDRAITQLVFRLVPNSGSQVPGDANRIRITRASADHGGGRFTFSRAHAVAGSQGGLLHIPFAASVPAGTTVTATVDFVLTVGPVVAQAFPRIGRTDGFVYFGSGEPLLSWQRGYGWHTEDLVDFPAESATSEAMDVDLTVTAPKADTVIMSGDPAAPPVTGAATRTWHSTLTAARDVSVAAGPFAVSDTTVDGVMLRLGAYSPAVRDQLVPEFRRAITELVKRYGPFPFPSLSVARVPAEGGGIEYPSSILMLDGSRLVAVHETAHQYFYAMVGDSQAQHPWLDEAFAQYSEQEIDGTPAPAQDLTLAGRVDSSIGSYGEDGNTYYTVTYYKGAAALEAARRAAGATAFDAALRCYVAANAWRIAVPADLAKALTRLPKALTVLRRAGALP
jgi:hypothetical protein